MAEEFIDFYEVLELPMESDRDTLRKRINELYLEAQRNIDHRHFATRAKFQEVFEVTMPRARIILLDDDRRDEYDRLVRAFRAAKNGGPPVPADLAAKSAISKSATSPGAASSQPDFFLPRAEPDAEPDAELVTVGQRAPVVEPLPEMGVDPARVEHEREELWKKWKSGLESALSAEAEKPRSRAAITSAPTWFSVPEEPLTAAGATTPVARPGATESTARVSDSNSAPDAGFDDRNQSVISSAEIEARRLEHRRQLMREVLVNVGLIWGTLGAAILAVPGVIALIAAAAHFYPRGERALLGFPSFVLWGGGLLVIGLAAFFAGRGFSSFMRRKKELELSLLADEEFLERVGKS